MALNVWFCGRRVPRLDTFAEVSKSRGPTAANGWGWKAVGEGVKVRAGRSGIDVLVGRHSPFGHGA